MKNNLLMVGWREWVSLPELNIGQIKVKVDTGAKTSCLHAYFVEPYHKGEELWVRFGIHPTQDCTQIELLCDARVVDQREITDSGGHKESRYVIRTPLTLGGITINTEMTLTNRDTMKFRMLLGRNTLNNNCIVDPVKSFLLGPIENNRSTDNEELDDSDSESFEE
jgi:hypothetical protein